MIEISEEIQYMMLFTIKKVKTLQKHAENFMKYTVKMMSLSEGLSSGLLDSVPEI